MNTMDFSQIDFVAEGIPDEEILKRLAKELGIKLGKCLCTGGKSRIREQINGLNNYARYQPIIVLVDLDNDYQCAPDLISEWIPNPAQYMRFRIAVREIEVWLMADNGNLSRFLNVDVSFMPSYPETLNDPKQAMMNLVKRSRKKSIRKDMLPDQESCSKIGSLYNYHLVDFIWNYWSPEIAVEKSDSLKRCMKRLQELR